nr:CheR family methyltransferase [Ameyamaea chiangmaiensis]
METRIHACGCDTAEAYGRLLDHDAQGAEWRALESLITIRETFFFRDAAQFEALEHVILPRLLRERAAARTLRIWSAGCSNGAEPYSLAILVRRLLDSGLVADAARWTVDILGTDLSQFALSEARGHVFRPWSLRGLTREQISRWFERVPGEQLWRLRDRFADMVRFEHGNLLDVIHPCPKGPTFDLILCRNVLIYFTPARVADIVEGLASRLAPSGWLMLGHAEAGVAADRLAVERFAGAQAYRLGPVVACAGPRAVRAAIVPPVAPAVEGEDVPRARSSAREPAAAEVASARATHILASASAGAEALGTARRACEEMVRSHPMVAVSHYTDALLCMAAGEAQAAIAALRRVIYLERTHVMAHYHLAQLLGAGDAAGAERARARAAELASAVAADTILEGGDGLTAAGLLVLLGVPVRGADGGTA